MSDTARRKSPTRIQREKREAILEAALDVFSTHGFRGATLDLIADAAGLSKPNLLYYFPSKEEIHRTLIGQLMEIWLAPLRKIDPGGDPVSEICAYVERKLEISRDLPRESRLFANEVLRGAPHVGDMLQGGLKALADEKAAVIRAWSEAGHLAPVDPHHLIFSIWAATQHYADFDTQVAMVLGPRDATRYEDARAFLLGLYARGLRPLPAR